MHEIRIDRMCGMDENNRLPLIHLLPNRLESLVSQIIIPVAISSEERHSVCL